MVARLLNAAGTARSKPWGSSETGGGIFRPAGHSHSTRSVLLYTPANQIQYRPVSQIFRCRQHKLGQAEEDLATHLTTAGVRLAMNPRLQLSTFYQYNSFDGQGKWNVRASREYQPLSFVYVVFNDSRVEDELDPFQEQQFISKITLVKQF